MADSNGKSGWFLSGFFASAGMSMVSPLNTMIDPAKPDVLLTSGATYVFLRPAANSHFPAGMTSEPSRATCSFL